MRVAVISDIHSNLPALNTVLADIDRLEPSPEQIWCLGDVVGYGAHPNECCAITEERADVCLAGNHDLVVRGDLDISHFTRSAEEAAIWTMERLDERARAFLAPLQPLGQSSDVGLFHGSPRDPVWEYVLSLDQARACLDLQRDRICLIGHSHVACHFSRHDGEVNGALAPAGTGLELMDGEWILNAGSVGQPRDGDPRAAYVVLDTAQWKAEFRRVPYAVEEAAEAIVRAGLPPDLGARLYSGH